MPYWEQVYKKTGGVKINWAIGQNLEGFTLLSTLKEKAIAAGFGTSFAFDAELAQAFNQHLKCSQRWRNRPLYFLHPTLTVNAPDTGNMKCYILW